MGAWMELQGRVALVSGAAGGIGREWCRMLLEEGADLAALDMSDAALEPVCAALRQDFPEARVLPVVADVAQDAACREAVATVAAELGDVDVLINNASVSHLSSPSPPCRGFTSLARPLAGVSGWGSCGRTT